MDFANAQHMPSPCLTAQEPLFCLGELDDLQELTISPAAPLLHDCPPHQDMSSPPRLMGTLSPPRRFGQWDGHMGSFGAERYGSLEMSPDTGVVTRPLRLEGTVAVPSADWGVLGKRKGSPVLEEAQHGDGMLDPATDSEIDSMEELGHDRYRKKRQRRRHRRRRREYEGVGGKLDKEVSLAALESTELGLANLAVKQPRVTGAPGDHIFMLTAAATQVPRNDPEAGPPALSRARTFPSLGGSSQRRAPYTLKRRVSVATEGAPRRSRASSRRPQTKLIGRRVRVVAGKHMGAEGVVMKSGHGFYGIELDNGQEIMKRAIELETVDAPEGVAVAEAPAAVVPPVRPTKSERVVVRIRHRPKAETNGYYTRYHPRSSMRSPSSPPEQEPCRSPEPMASPQSVPSMSPVSSRGSSPGGTTPLPPRTDATSLFVLRTPISGSPTPSQESRASSPGLLYGQYH